MSNFCPDCGTKLNDNQEVCLNCGCEIKKNRKKKNNKMPIWVAIIVTIVIVIGIFIRVGEIPVVENNDNADNNIDDLLKETNDSLMELYESMCKENYQEIDYSLLSRNPDNYKSNCIHFKGKVIQVLEDFSKNQAQLRVYTKMSNYSYIENEYTDDPILVNIYNYDQNNRILEDDIIDINGVYNGIVTYEAIMGNSISIPSMTSVNYSIIN